jgi:phosphate starvation-inducible PhoH-like protein
LNSEKKKIFIEIPDPLNFAGPEDNYLKIIQNSFSADIFMRGNNVFIQGTDEEIKPAEVVIKELKLLQEKQGKISESDINLIIDLVCGSQIPILEKTTGVKINEIDQIIFADKSVIIKPKTQGQISLLKAATENEIVFAIGPAGTGKTYLAVAIALAELKSKKVSRIILSRPAVEAGESLGYLPGDLSEKVDPYLKPLFDALEDMLPREKLRSYIEKKIIEIIPLAYMRGRTLNNSFLILDEAQNATALQMKMFLTRLGINSKAIITGDITQIDLPLKQTSGLVQIQNILKGIEGVAFVYLSKSDVVRHKLVKDIINAYEDFSSKQNGNSQ